MTAAAPAKPYAIERSDALADGPRLLSLWGSGLSHRDMPEAKLDWFYRSHPEGPPLVLLLRHADSADPIGVAAAGRRRFALGDRALQAGAMVDFVVRPEHRTLFPALFLQKAIVREALATHDLLFGMPNARSTAAIVRAGYKLLGSRVRRVRVLRSARYLARHVPGLLATAIGALADAARLAIERARMAASPGFRGEWIDRPDARFDDLWRRARDPGQLTGARDAAFLAWRFADCPLRRHRFFTLVSASDGRLAGYAACESIEQVLHVRDFLVDPAMPGAWRRFWAQLSVEAHAQGCASIDLLFLGSDGIQLGLAAAGFVPRGEYATYAVLPAALAALADPSRWYLTDADDDV